MFAARLALNAGRAFASAAPGASNALMKPTLAGPRLQALRQYASEARSGFGRHAERRRTVKEVASAPATSTPFNVGQGALAGAAAMGLGALCFYGLGFSNTPAHLAADASALFSRNHYNFLSAFWDKEAGRPVLDEEIGDAIRLTKGGEVVNERLKGGS